MSDTPALSGDFKPGTQVYWFYESMPGRIVGPSPVEPWHWQIELDIGRTILAYTDEVTVLDNETRVC